MTDGKRGHVPRIVLEEQLDALVVHDVTVLNAVRAQANRVLHRIGVGGVRHHPEFTLAADGEGRRQLVFKQKRMPVSVPRGAHDAAGEIQLDVIDAVFDLFADCFDEAVRTIALQGVPRGQKVTAGGGEKMAAGVNARTDILP